MLELKVFHRFLYMWFILTLLSCINKIYNLYLYDWGSTNKTKNVRAICVKGFDIRLWQWNYKFKSEVNLFNWQSKNKTPVKAIVEPTIISWCVSSSVLLTWWAISISKSKYFLIHSSVTLNVCSWYFSRGLNVSIFVGIQIVLGLLSLKFLLIYLL